MAYGDRQIYRSRNFAKNKVVNSRGSRYAARKSSNIVVNKIKRNIQSSYNEHFNAEININEIQKTFSKVQELEDIANSKIQEPEFPMKTFGMALFVDVFALLQLTGILWFLTASMNIGFKVALLFIMWGKISSSFKMGSKALFKSSSYSRKIFMKYFGKRLAFLAILDSIPFIGILASDAFFVYLAHKKHKKIVREYIIFVSVVGKVLSNFYRKNPNILKDSEE